MRFGSLAFLALLALAPTAAAAPATPVPEPGCVSCHARLVTPPVRHAALDDGCDTCHEPAGDAPVRGRHGKNAFKPVTDQKALCGNCHDTAGTFGGRAGPHKPAAEGGCTKCHDPHAAAHPRLLRTPVPALCTGCHPMQKVPQEHGPYASGECLACHDAHGGAAANVLKKAQPELCFGCHDEMRANFASAHLHAPAKDQCSGCHDPHGSRNPLFLSARKDDLCRKCHAPVFDAAAKATQKHDAMSEGCASCHDAHGTSTPRLLVQEPTTLCGACHEDIRKKAETWPSVHVRDQGCPSCHAPHGSSIKPLLADSYPAGKTYHPFQGNPYSLCFQCHESRMLETGPGTPATNFRDGNRNLHALHVARKDKGRACGVCHDVHGAPGPHMVRKDIPFGTAGWRLNIGHAERPDGGTCRSACHSPKNYRNRQAPPRAPAPAEGTGKPADSKEKAKAR